MDLVVYDDDDKRYIPFAVAVAAVLLVVLATAVLTFLVVRQASGDQGEQSVGGVSSPDPATAPSPAPSAAAPGPAATGPAPTAAAPTAAAPTTPAPTTPAPTAAAPIVGPTPAPACVAALLRADAALERAVTVDEALAQHTAIMDELLAERIDAQEALDRTLPVLTAGATERRRLEQDLSAYSESRQECPD